MCHSPSSVCFSVLILHLKFTGRHGERWMDREREGGREQERDGGVCRCPLKGKEHLDSLSRKKKKKKTSHVSLFVSLSLFFHFSLSLHSLSSFTLSFPVSSLLPSPPLMASPSFLTPIFKHLNWKCLIIHSRLH